MAIVATRSGKVEGIERDGIHVFKGIPYAAPPVGAGRWKAPRREETWDGVRDATRFSAQSAQSEFALTKMLGAARPPYSEDSLYLNIWTPACDDAARPVMVWIHGGAFIWGAGDTPWYDGTKFATQGDVVLVTINYRLGPFGYLYLPELFGDAFAESGNLGLLDQVAALDWVRDCIGAFGGDPNQVTIFGESAGAASVSTLLGTPAARGLFTRAIAQSGAASWIATPNEATAIAAGVVKQLGVRAGDTDALLAQSTDAVIDALPSWREGEGSGLPFQPVHDSAVLPQPPLDAIRAGSAAGIGVISGTNKDEIKLFQFGDESLASLTDEQLLERVRTWCGERAGALIADYQTRRPGAAPRDVWTALATDAVFFYPSSQLLDAQSVHADTWAYYFTWETPLLGGIFGSAHALEIPFVFDNLDRGGAHLFTGDGPERAGIASAMHRAWIAFACTGNPNHDGLPEWPQCAPPERATMQFDADLEVVRNRGEADRQALDRAVG
jgi:para-nitrobenzyl esterase